MSYTSSTLIAPSYSRMATFNSCRRKYFNRYVLGLRRHGPPPLRPLAGTAGHAALDVLHRRGFDEIEAAHLAICDTYAKALGAAVPQGPHAFLTAEHVMGITVQYVRHYAEDDDDFVPLRMRPEELSNALVAFEGQVDADGFMVLAEAPMTVRLENGELVQVVIDLAVRRSDGSVSAVDHKWTASYLGDGISKRYTMSHQPRLYVLALRALLRENVDGAIINAVHMGKGANSVGSNALRFDRYEFPYTEGQLQETLQWVSITKREMMMTERALGNAEAPWLQNTESFCSDCDFAALCEVPPGTQRSQRKETLYNIEGGRG